MIAATRIEHNPDPSKSQLQLQPTLPIKRAATPAPFYQIKEEESTGTTALHNCSKVSKLQPSRNNLQLLISKVNRQRINSGLSGKQQKVAQTPKVAELSMKSQTATQQLRKVVQASEQRHRRNLSTTIHMFGLPPPNQSSLASIKDVSSASRNRRNTSSLSQRSNSTIIKMPVGIGHHVRQQSARLQKMKQSATVGFVSHPEPWR